QVTEPLTQRLTSLLRQKRRRLSTFVIPVKDSEIVSLLIKSARQALNSLVHQLIAFLFFLLLRCHATRSFATMAATAASIFRLERSEEHTSELQSRENLVCRLLLEKKKNLAI